MSSPPTLLLADDSVAIQRVVALTFAREPVRLVVAKDGQDAINRMTADRPDLVLADTNMPCVDGYDVARWVRRQPHLAGVPVLLLAGATDPVDEQRLHDSGANGVLEKPFEPSHVISRVKELLGIRPSTPAEPSRLIPPPDRSTAEPGPPPEPPRPLSTSPVPAAAATGSSRTGPAEELTDFPATSIEDALAAVDERERLARDEGTAAAASADESWSAGSVRRHAVGGRADDWFPARASDWPVPDREPASPSDAAWRPATTAGVSPTVAPADVFERLLAAEQGDTGAALPGSDARAAGGIITIDELEQLEGRLARVVHEAVARDVRVAVAETMRTTVDSTLPGAVRSAVHEAVAAALPEAVRDLVASALRQQVREAIDAALPGIVDEAVAGALRSTAPPLVRETAERLVRDEIARIRSRGA